MTNTKTITVCFNEICTVMDSNKSPVQLKLHEDRLEIMGLPETDSLEYLAKSQFDTYYVAHRPSKCWSHDELRLHIGKENSLVEAAIKSMDGALNGGTTFITYTLHGKVGMLKFPPSYRNISPTDYYDGSLIKLKDILENSAVA